ncbi:MAG: hypothetical protein FJ135_15040 [Deltaproteobacteria bacterium]|nr:hypothetical protein [Deltaproteobacteria bacterium]
MSDHWFWLFIAGTLLLWLGSLLAMRSLTRTRLLRSFAAEASPEEEIPLPFQNPRPEDRQALEVIRRYRRRYLLKLQPDTGFSLKLLNAQALELIQEIARVYHPEDDSPELHASLAELLNLQTRIGLRLQALLETMPFRALKDVELQTILFYHKLYKQVANHPAYVFMKRHHLDKAARWAVMLKNIANPWYWGGRAAYASSKEMLARIFLARMCTIVGVEAIRVYSGRSPGAEHWRKYDLAVQEMLYLSGQNGIAAAEALKFVLRFVLASRELPEQAKVLLAERICRERMEQPADFNTLTPAEQQQVRGWLKNFILEVTPPAARKSRLQELRQRL